MISEEWQALQKLRGNYRSDIRVFVKKEFGVELESYQRDVLGDFGGTASHSKQVMASSAGVGKSATIAWCMLWFMFVYDFAQGVSISMTFDNLRDGLWKELGYWLNKSELLRMFFDLNQRRLFHRQYGGTWFISARTYDKKVDRSRAGEILSGFHAEHIGYFVDEAGGIYPEVGKSIEQGFGESGGKFVRAIFAGNPMSKDSLLHKESKDKKNFVIHVTSDPDDPKRSNRISKEWAQDQIDKLGREDPWVQVFILAQFPDVALSSLLDETDVEEAMERSTTGVDVSDRELRLGVDVAGYGPDSNVFFPRKGLIAYPFESIRNARGAELYTRVMRLTDKFGMGMAQVFIDTTGGWGSSLEDIMFENGHFPNCINFGEKALRDDKFFNLRTEMYFKMSEWVKRGGILPRSMELKRELTEVLYGYDNKRRMKLESKEQIKGRLKRSPDNADALALTFATPDTKIGDDYQDALPKKRKWRNIYDYGLT